MKLANRMQAENDRQVQLQEEHQSHLLDTAAWQDVNDYLAECNMRKRLSLAFRAKEKRRHFQVEKKSAACAKKVSMVGGAGYAEWEPKVEPARPMRS